MAYFKRMALEALTLGVIATAIAFAINGVRARGSVQFSRDYFPRVRVAPKASDATGGARSKVQAGSERPPETNPAAMPTAYIDEVRQVGSGLADDSAECVGQYPRHPFREVTFDEVVDIYNDPNTERCLNVFVDARSDMAYQQGHIPGAIQVDHYRLKECIDLVLPYVQGAEKVIVYCNGGDCEDSLFLCSDLSEMEVPDGKLYLYHGGWNEWVSMGMPIAKGAMPRGE